MDFTQNSLLKFRVCYSSRGRHKSAKAVCKFSSNSCPRFTEHNRALIFMRLKEFLWVPSDLLRVVGNLLLRAFIMSAFPKMLRSHTLNRGSLLCVHFFREAKERVRKNYEDEGKGKMKDFSTSTFLWLPIYTTDHSAWLLVVCWKTLSFILSLTCVFGKENIQSKLEEKIVKDTLFSKNLF